METPRRPGNFAALPVFASHQPSHAAPPIVHDVLRGPGQPLDPDTRSFMEPRFGRGFSNVRVHADPLAAASARAVGAAAYAAGSDIVFGAGRYQPQSAIGRRLLAHELTHVVQQSGAAQAPVGESHEAEANHAAATIDHGTITVRQSSQAGLARLTVAELEQSVWARVPAGVKPYVRPLAMEAKAALDTVALPNMEIPPKAAAVIEHPLATAQAATAAATEKVKTAASQIPKSLPAAMHAVSQKAKEKTRDYTMEAVGEVKGVALEATSIIDTALWASYAAHQALDAAAAGNKYGETVAAVVEMADNYHAMLAIAQKHGFADKTTGAPAISQVFSDTADEWVDVAGQAVFGDVPPEQATFFTSYETGELEGSIGIQAVLAFTGAEEVTIALRALGLLGGAKGIYDRVAFDRKTGKNWATDIGFWSAIAGMVLQVIGLKAARSANKLLKTVLASGNLIAAATPAMQQLIEHYEDKALAAHPAEREKTLQHDAMALVKIAAHAVIDGIRNAHEAPPGAGKSTGKPATAGNPGSGTASEGTAPASQAAPKPLVAKPGVTNAFDEAAAAQPAQPPKALTRSAMAAPDETPLAAPRPQREADRAAGQTGVKPAGSEGPSQPGAMAAHGSQTAPGTASALRSLRAARRSPGSVEPDQLARAQQAITHASEESLIATARQAIAKVQASNRAGREITLADLNAAEDALAMLRERNRLAPDPELVKHATNLERDFNNATYKDAYTNAVADPANADIKYPAGVERAAALIPGQKAMSPREAYDYVLARRGFDKAVPVHQQAEVDGRIRILSGTDETPGSIASMKRELAGGKIPPGERQQRGTDIQTAEKELKGLKAAYAISVPGAGGPAGLGFNTYAVVQVIGPDGRLIAWGDGRYAGSGPHAEEIAIDQLHARLAGQNTSGARVVVVGDRVVCPDVCTPALQKFATDTGAASVEGYVYQRPRASGAGDAPEKTTAVTATKRSIADKTAGPDGTVPLKEIKKTIFP